MHMDRWTDRANLIHAPQGCKHAFWKGSSQVKSLTHVFTDKPHLWKQVNKKFALKTGVFAICTVHKSICRFHVVTFWDVKKCDTQY
jgi:hypothetical protein